MLQFSEHRCRHCSLTSRVVATSLHLHIYRHSIVSTCKLRTKTDMIKSKYWLVFVFT